MWYCYSSICYTLDFSTIGYFCSSSFLFLSQYLHFSCILLLLLLDKISSLARVNRFPANRSVLPVCLLVCLLCLSVHLSPFISCSVSPLSSFRLLLLFLSSCLCEPSHGVSQCLWAPVHFHLPPAAHSHKQATFLTSPSNNTNFNEIITKINELRDKKEKENQQKSSDF